MRLTSEGINVKSLLYEPLVSDLIAMRMRVVWPSPLVVKRYVRSPTPLCTTVPSCDQVMAALPRKVPTPCTSMSTGWLGPGVSGETVYCRGSDTACACATPAVSKRTTSAMLRSFCIGFIADLSDSYCLYCRTCGKRRRGGDRGEHEPGPHRQKAKPR